MAIKNGFIINTCQRRKTISIYVLEGVIKWTLFSSYFLNFNFILDNPESQAGRFSSFYTQLKNATLNFPKYLIILAYIFL